MRAAAEQAVQIGRELVAILAAWRRAAPSLAGAIEDADARRRCERPLHPRPARGSFAEPVEKQHRWRAGTDPVQVETVAIDEIRAATRCGVARRCLGDGLEGTADRDEHQNEEGRVEQRAP